jgi:hypothetical protein
MAPKTEEAIAEYVAFPDHRLNEFDPWANLFDYDAFSRSCRQVIEAIPAIVTVLTETETDPGCVEDLGALNRWPERSGVPP